MFASHVLFPLGICNADVAAFLALADVLDLIVNTAKGIVAHDTLLDAIHKFLELFVAAWGFEWLIPKVHWLLHLPAQMLRNNGKLLNCFCLERKHRTAKAHASGRKVSNRTSKSLLS